jgi:hypothetical protein
MSGSRSSKSAPHGAPLSTPKPGGTKRKRPKVGDKDPSYKKKAKRRKRPVESKPSPEKKPVRGGPVFRDYRGTEGVIDDATGVKKKR